MKPFTPFGCPGMQSRDSFGGLAVETGVFPLYEIENGKYRITVDVPELRPVSDYLKPQGRFRHLTPDRVDQIQERVTREYNELKAKTTR